MTEQQAKVIEIRLTRIWEPNDEGLTWDWTDHMLHGQLKVGLYFLYTPFADRRSDMFAISAPEGGILDYFDGEISSFGSSTLKKAPDQFIARWLAYFQRGCWLSGANIEASAHEKAEWVQGFTREEIDSWNLRV